VDRIRHILPFVSDKFESPLESLAWLCIYKIGLVLPLQQVKFPNIGARVDMYYPKQKLVIELDGKIKYQSRDDIFMEKIREDKLRKLGLKVLRVTWYDVKKGFLEEMLEEFCIKKRRRFGLLFPIF
jgi:very-short-patch-repair endonuclease